MNTGMEDILIYLSCVIVLLWDFGRCLRKEKDNNHERFWSRLIGPVPRFTNIIVYYNLLTW